MSEELANVIDLIKFEFNIDGNITVLHTEDGVMHTVRSGNVTVKAVWIGDEWVLTELT